MNVKVKKSKYIHVELEMVWDEQVFVSHGVYPLFLYVIEKVPQPLTEGQVGFWVFWEVHH